LVVIAIIALLVGILLPALATARRAARNTVSLVNLKSLAQSQLNYTVESKDTWLFPWFVPNQTIGASAFNWFTLTLPQRRNEPAPPRFAFDDANYQTEMFAFHWASYLLNYMNPNDLRSQVQFSPSDESVIRRFNTFVNSAEARTFGIDGVIWDGSYVMSPTFWFNAQRYRGNGQSLPTPQAPPDNRAVRANKTSDVQNPTAKALLWERFDYKSTKRGGGEAKSPQWNNTQAIPNVAFADGSASEVQISRLLALSNDADPNTARIYNPLGTIGGGGNWTLPTALLDTYDMANDGWENGAGGTRAFKAFFWSTRDGIRGRDVSR
jgi:type II secretory pathway pseudopilin PulG